jgi:4-hydroxy-tetrahydrodipicolinate reductase
MQKKDSYMKIALVGYGKMGKEIEHLALDAGHEVVLKIDSSNLLIDNLEVLADVDVAIEFSTPESAYENICLLLSSKVPVVCGTTAWLERRAEVESMCLKEDTAFFYASNFSLGVNLFFKLNQQLASLMSEFQDQYRVSLKEIHHTTKLDAPSGTGISLAEDIIDILPNKTAWSDKIASDPNLLIASERLPNVPGTHDVNYESDVDSITISHVAHSRKGFAQGALLAAQWLVGKKGIYGMKDMLKF